MKLRVVVLGAGFGGLELATILSAQMGDELDLTLIDQNDHFIFGFSKLDIMFGRKAPDSVRRYYKNIDKRGVRFHQGTITAIDPLAKRITTDSATFDADIIVIALGATYDPAATPGLVEGGYEYYSVAGAIKLREVLPTFTKGHAIIGITFPTFKCPPAPSETSLLLHDYLTARGVRDACTISLVMPFGIPIPPSPETSQGLLAAFRERGITYVADRLVKAVDSARHVVTLDNGSEMPCDLFLGVPKHCVPDVVAQSGLSENGWIPVDKTNLKTRFPGVYAIGDVNSVGTPKSGTFAEAPARVVAATIIADFKSGAQPPAYNGIGGCYIEFGAGRVGGVEVDFFSGPRPTGTFTEPSVDLVKEKVYFETSRSERWFGHP